MILIYDHYYEEFDFSEKVELDGRYFGGVGKEVEKNSWKNPCVRD